MIWKKSEADEAVTPLSSPAQTSPSASSRSAQPTKDHALIGPSIEIKGSITGDEDLQIEGRFEGKIELRQHGVTIGKSGHVRADIFGGTIVVMGRVEGNLYGQEKIVLRQSSIVSGNLMAPRVTIEDGSNFKGTIDMTAADAAASSLKSATPQILQREQVADKV